MAVNNGVDRLFEDSGYSRFEREVVAYIRDKAEALEPGQFPKEAFSKPEAFVNTIMDDTLAVEIAQKNRWVSPEEAVRYLGDNVEEFCAVLDIAGKLEGADRRIVEDPQQVIVDVYAEEAKQLLAYTPFYFNQSMCQEQSENRLDREDIKSICANLNKEVHDRNDDIVQFNGSENGKPFTAEFRTKEALGLVNDMFGNTVGTDKQAEEMLNRLVVRAARDFRVMGPAETYADFNLQVKSYAKEIDRSNPDLAKGIRDWHKAVDRCFDSGRAQGLGQNKEHANLRARTRENDMEHVRGGR